MIALVSRIAGLWLTAGAVVALVVDASRSIASSDLTITPLGATWYALGKESLINTQSFVQQQIETYIGQWLWDPLIQWGLLLPTWAVLGAAGLILIYLGRRRRYRAAYR